MTAEGDIAAGSDEEKRAVPVESESYESEDPDDTGDENFTPDSEADEGEQLTAESATSEPKEDEDISIFLMDADLRTRVKEITQGDACENRCVEGKAKELEFLLTSLEKMSKTERMTSLHTLLALLMVAPTAERKRGKGVRDKFLYYLPFVGRVCQPVVALCYGVVPLTIQRYKSRIRNRSIAVANHGNTRNKHAAKVDVVWLVKWFKRFAGEMGEVVPVRVRMQKKIDGTVQKYYSGELYTLLPAHFTWDAIYEEMHKFVESGLMVREPARSTTRKLLTLHCPTIRIRSPRSNVCDICAIDHSGMRSGVTTDTTEALGRHTESARRMRREYQQDKFSGNDDHVVMVMDYSQNLTIPSVANTPSQWYFCSLVAVSCFGIYYENEGVQTNYLYDESTSGKGSDQINSMLSHFITKIVAEGKKRLTFYADNCSGQNKNNYVIKLLLAHVDMGKLEHVDYKFFVKGHTKNSCDRGFGHIRKHMGSVDIWTMDHLVEAVDAAASTAITVHIPRGSDFFKGFKEIMQELYKTLDGVQQFQIFSMDSSKPGVVLCRKGPDSDVVEKDLRRKIDGILTPKEKVKQMMEDHVETLPPPPLNAEKITQMYKTIRPYVPADTRMTQSTRNRATSREQTPKQPNKQDLPTELQLAVAAKENQDQRGMVESVTGAKKTAPNAKK